MVDENTHLLVEISNENENENSISSNSSLNSVSISNSNNSNNSNSSINSIKSSEKSEIVCRICYEPIGLEPLLCNCEGSNRVHHDCMLRWLNTSNTTSCEICHKEFRFIENNKTRCFKCYKRICFGYMIYFFIFSFIYLGLVRYSHNYHNLEKIFLNIHLINIIVGIMIILLYNISKKSCDLGNRVIYIENEV